MGMFTKIAAGAAGAGAASQSQDADAGYILNTVGDKVLKAFHGGHAGIKKFSTDYIGTGEGAQAYSWGLYFADRKGVAKSYRDDLVERGGLLHNYEDLSATVDIDGQQIDVNAADWVRADALDGDEYKQAMTKAINRSKNWDYDSVAESMSRLRNARGVPDKDWAAVDINEFGMSDDPFMAPDDSWAVNFDFNDPLNNWVLETAIDQLAFHNPAALLRIDPEVAVSYAKGGKIPTYADGEVNPAYSPEYVRQIYAALDEAKPLIVDARDSAIAKVDEGAKLKWADPDYDEPPPYDEITAADIYTVEINVSDDEMMDWFEPLSTRSEKVRNAAYQVAARETIDEAFIDVLNYDDLAPQWLAVQAKLEKAGNYRGMSEADRDLFVDTIDEIKTLFEKATGFEDYDLARAHQNLDNYQFVDYNDPEMLWSLEQYSKALANGRLTREMQIRDLTGDPANYPQEFKDEIDRFTGRNLYDSFVRDEDGNVIAEKAKEFSLELLDQGVKGMQYYDFTRNRGDLAAQTYNYVLYTDEVIDITNRGAATAPFLGTLGTTAAASLAAVQESQEKDGFWNRVTNPDTYKKAVDPYIDLASRAAQSPLGQYIGGNISEVMDTMEMPTRGWHGIGRGLFGLATGEGKDKALENAADAATSSIEDNAKKLEAYALEQGAHPEDAKALYWGTLGSDITNFIGP
jgi:hypothetical protein